MAVNYMVTPKYRGESFEKMMKRFNRKVDKFNIIDDFLDSSVFVKPSARRRRERQAAAFKQKHA